MQAAHPVQLDQSLTQKPAALCSDIPWQHMHALPLCSNGFTRAAQPAALAAMAATVAPSSVNCTAALQLRPCGHVLHSLTTCCPTNSAPSKTCTWYCAAIALCKVCCAALDLPVPVARGLLAAGSIRFTCFWVDHAYEVIVFLLILLLLLLLLLGLL